MREELVNKLKRMQSWRRGENCVMPYTPKEYGLMIDACIHILLNMSDELFNELINDSNGR